jgi:hypothetical protein
MEAADTAAVEAVVARYRDEPSDRELEVRLGRYVNGRFIAGVEREEFDRLVADFEASPQLQAEEGWSEVLDYHYSNRDCKTRTRVSFDAQDMQLRTEHISKKTVADVVMKHTGGETTAYRVSFARETPVAAPEVCIPSFVRIKQRRRFRDVRQGRLVWLYEASKTWSAASRSAVEHAQHMLPPVYEVECELVDEGGTYGSANSAARVAKSIVLKAQLLAGEGGADAAFRAVVRDPSATAAAASTGANRASKCFAPPVVVTRPPRAC